MRLTDDQLARAIEHVGQNPSGAIFARMPEGIDEVDDLYEILSELHELRENANGIYNPDARAVWHPMPSEGWLNPRCRHCQESTISFDSDENGRYCVAYQDVRFVCGECYGEGMR